MLDVQDLHAGYDSVTVLHGVTVNVAEGEVVVLLGANGAGKPTTMRALNGSLPSEGTLNFRGQDIGSMSVSRIVRLGVATVPQGRGTFPDLTVSENLTVGAHSVRSRKEIGKQTSEWLERFPRLGERKEQRAGTLSGGEQQMLAVARAMMSNPALLLLDEPSLGLAPLVVQELFGLLREINKERGTAMLVVEQSAELALDIADRGFVLEAGETVLSGTADELRGNSAVRQAYLGM
uniref:ABC transporter ATP-binding protein n=1 Tax=Gephyromycinifex aptenodytis TaxID=2716227 RepID=UPI00385579B2